MPNKFIPYVKVLLHLFCLGPFLYLLQLYRSGELLTETDPVAIITHLTGKWALWILIASLAVTPLRRLHPKLGNLIRFRRMIGLYAFFYATLHLATYLFLFSGYDVPTAYASVKTGHLGDLWRQWLLVWPNVKDDLLKRKFIQIGFFAWVVLLALAVTSPTRMLRAMGGKNWQRLHRLVYAAAIAGCLHYWWLVKAGVRSPLADTLALTVLLAARVGWVVWKKQKAKQILLEDDEHEWEDDEHEVQSKTQAKENTERATLATISGSNETEVQLCVCFHPPSPFS